MNDPRHFKAPFIPKERIWQEADRLRAAHTAGHELPIQVPDPDGLWIHRAVADALNNKDASDMRSGFTMKLFNLRGVHGFSSGKEELAIAEGFHKKAEALEEDSFQRIATAMRELVKGYERDAEREAQRNPYGD